MELNRPDIKFPIEKELLVYQIKGKIRDLPREDLESYFIDCALALSKLTFQTHHLLDYIFELEGKLQRVE